VSGAALDRLLAALLVVQLASGLLTLRAGTPATAPLFWLHGLVGGALLVAAAEKLRRSVGPAWRRRRWARLALGGLLALLVAAALVGGFAWVAGGRILSLGPWTVLTLHVWAALAAVPIVLVHVAPRRWRLLRVPREAPRMSRRALLGLGATLGFGAVAWGAANLADRLQEGVRRFTGSRWLPDGGVPPPTTFYGEGAPAIDPVRWHLHVTGRVERELRLDRASIDGLRAEERDAVLDCTSGWALRTRWGGVPLRTLLDAAGARDVSRVAVHSATGWMVRLGPDELDEALLATHVAGRPLPAANGAPLRLVAPRRRGLDWIKWVERIEVA
jgi:hypothetical protein